MVADRIPLALRYAAFAVVAAAANWMMQLIVLRTLPGPLAIYPALAAGTVAGFSVKYLLDKNYIFYQTSSNIQQESWVLALYTGTSIVMTAGYIASQLIVFSYFGEGIAYYIVGSVALLLGYASKFFLDDRFVFNGRTVEGSPS